MGFWSKFGGDLISAGGSMFSSLFSSIAQREAEERQWKRTVKMWNMNNEYNKPVNQVLRLKEAGLNPALLYGNGSSSTGNSGSAAKPSFTASQSPLNFADVVDRVMQMRLMSKQLEFIDSQIEGKRKQNNLLDTQQSFKSAELANYLEFGRGLSEANLFNKRQQGIMLHSDATSREMLNTLKIKQLSESIRMMYLNMSKTDAETKRIYSDIALLNTKNEAARLGIRVSHKQLEILQQSLLNAIRNNKIADWLYSNKAHYNKLLEGLPEQTKLSRIMLDSYLGQYGTYDGTAKDVNTFLNSANYGTKAFNDILSAFGLKRLKKGPKIKSIR